MMLFILQFFILQFTQADVPSSSFSKNSIEEIHQKVMNASETIDAWTTRLNQENYDFLCLGESHNDFYRQFYGNIITRLNFNNLVLETTKEELADIIKNIKTNEATTFLGAPFLPLYNAIQTKTDLDIFPVESTQEQDALATKEAISGNKSLSRDGFIAENIIATYTPNEKTVAIYGRAHCSLYNNGLGSVPFFNFLKNYWTDKKIMNVMVLRRRASDTVHPLESYVDLGNETQNKPIVVINSSMLMPIDYNYNWEIMSLTQNFDYIIIY